MGSGGQIDRHPKTGAYSSESGQDALMLPILFKRNLEGVVLDKIEKMAHGELA